MEPLDSVTGRGWGDEKGFTGETSPEWASLWQENQESVASWQLRTIK